MIPSSARTIRIQVCVLTFQRPLLLAEAIRSVIAQRLQASAIELHLLVVDNDRAASGKPVYDALMAANPIPGRYVCEPTPGIASARNRALEESLDMDFVAFLDDDEAAAPEWLRRLHQTIVRNAVDVVTGPVIPSMPNAPAWLLRGGFFTMQPRPTGTEVDCVATNNVLLRANVVRNYRFDERFNTTGGEDTHLFMRMQRDGHRFLWCQEAEVVETVTPERMTVPWLLARARSDANRYTRCCLDLDDSWTIRLRRRIIACGGALAGVFQILLGVTGKHHFIRGLQMIYRARGTWDALGGERVGFYGAASPTLSSAEPRQ